MSERRSKSRRAPIVHRGVDYESRALSGHNPEERALAEAWERENTGDRWSGGGILESLLASASVRISMETRAGLLALAEDRRVTARDALVAATVVQWLGTSCGFAFLQQALLAGGWRIEKADILECERNERDEARAERRRRWKRIAARRADGSARSGCSALMLEILGAVSMSRDARTCRGGTDHTRHQEIAYCSGGQAPKPAPCPFCAAIVEEQNAKARQTTELAVLAALARESQAEAAEWERRAREEVRRTAAAEEKLRIISEYTPPPTTGRMIELEDET